MPITDVMMTGAKLLISGGQHAGTDVDGRLEAVRDATDDLDVVYYEDRRINDLDARSRVRAWITAPLLLGLIGIWIHIILRIIRQVSEGDVSLCKSIEDEFGAVIVFAEPPTHEIINSYPRPWACANWLGIIATGLLAMLALPNPTLAFGLTVLYLLLFAAVIFFVYLASSTTQREKAMLDFIEDHTRREGISKACLIIGSDHVDGVQELGSGKELDLKVVSS